MSNLSIQEQFIKQVQYQNNKQAPIINTNFEAISNNNKDQMSFLQFYSKQLNSTKQQNHKSTHSHLNKTLPHSEHPSSPTFPSNNILPHFLTMPDNPNSRSYASIFRSVSQSETPHSSPLIPLSTIDPVYKTVPEITKIDQIAKMIQPEFKFNTQRYNTIRFRQIHVFNFSNTYESETCISIVNDFNKNEKERIVPSKMNFEMYAECIHNQFKTNKVIDKSMIDDEKRELTVQKVDVQINTSHQYDQHDKKSHPSMDISREMVNKDLSKSIEKPLEKSIEKDQSSILYEPRKERQEISHLQLLRMEIENQKSRIPRQKDYFEIMQNKLMNLLKYVVESDEDKKLKGTNEYKIKHVLGEIGMYKGKKIDGELKIVQLQYFFNQIKELKKFKQQIQQEQKIKQIEIEAIKKSHEKKPSKAIKIQEKPPQLIDLSKRIEEDRKEKQKMTVKKSTNTKPQPRKAEPKKQAQKHYEIPKKAPVPKMSKNIGHLSAIKKVQSDQDSWFGNTLGF